MVFLVFLFAVFIILFLTNRSRYINIYWLGLILVYFVFTFLTRIFFAPNADSELYYFTMSLFIFAFIPFLLLTLSVLTFFNSKILMEKEGKRIRNLFISLLGVATLVLLLISVYFYMTSVKTMVAELIFYYIIALFVYLLWLFTSTAMYAVVYNATPILYQPDYIIVLGSGLIGDRVPPLLESRLDEAVQQFKKYGEEALFITSGGQGNDELVSEAAAMKKYIIEKYGILPNKIIAEDKSTTTYENMLFSKKIIDGKFKQAKGIFVTNNFHVLRASLYASKVGLKATGIASQTAFYYTPNAFVREFVALLEMKKWLHLLLVGLFTIAWIINLFAYIKS